MFIQPSWPAPKTIKAFTTLRACTEEAKPDLNHLLHLPSEPVWLKQVHGTRVVPALPENANQEADGSFSLQSGQVCLVQTADCLPLLICNKAGTKVSALHAGWRGLAKGILEAAFPLLQAAPEDLLVWFGPAIGPEKFEVGPDVLEAFLQQDPAQEAAFKPLGANKWLANLYHLAAHQCRRLGISAYYGGEYCTFTQKEQFFSYRRDKDGLGHRRILSLIWIEK